MKLTLLRTKFFKTHTLGQLYIDGNFFCFTLEDVVREVTDQNVKGWKIEGETAIPYGTYKVVFENSKKFGPETLTLKDVPGFEFIRIHSGNDWDDTEGCILVGYKLVKDVIAYGSTRPALADLKSKVRNATETTIDIANHPKK